ncbi:hypothetical protein HaLaN_13659 [Haematococcus lacustris]|uniref:Uncharacterized protein n=1 Tax=Haematococcus lacustris TaxID=44745 RepID=A0A699Z3D7_HAELA|nr:hypothetical protein HaLaN_13659 [Haematococcus lacustris]
MPKPSSLWHSSMCALRNAEVVAYIRACVSCQHRFPGLRKRVGVVNHVLGNNCAEELLDSQELLSGCMGVQSHLHFNMCAAGHTCRHAASPQQAYSSALHPLYNSCSNTAVALRTRALTVAPYDGLGSTFQQHSTFLQIFSASVGMLSPSTMTAASKGAEWPFKARHMKGHSAPLPGRRSDLDCKPGMQNCGIQHATQGREEYDAGLRCADGLGSS